MDDEGREIVPGQMVLTRSCGCLGKTSGPIGRSRSTLGGEMRRGEGTTSNGEQVRSEVQKTSGEEVGSREFARRILSFGVAIR